MVYRLRTRFNLGTQGKSAVLGARIRGEDGVAEAIAAMNNWVILLGAG